MNTGLAIGKYMMVMSYPASAPQLRSYFGSNLVVIDPDSPEEAEVSIVRHLRAVHAHEDAKKAMLFLSTVALGLLIVVPAD